MGKSRILTGTVWHTEKFVRQEGDPRRHRSRCINYNSETKHCSYMCGQCVGSAHCSHYKERIIPQPAPNVKPQEKPRMDFSGVKEIPMSQIEINLDKARKPGKEKVDNLIAYYKQNGKLDKPIVVSVQGGKYLLEDKYLRYYVAKQLNLKTISAKIGTFKQSTADDRLHKVDTRVIHKTFGNGVVVNSNGNHTTIKFESGKEMSFDIAMCIQNGIITFRP